MSDWNRTIYRTKIDKFNDVISILANSLERHLHGVSIAAGVRHGKKLGFVGDDIARYGNSVGEMTQSMYNRASRPLILNNDYFRTLFPFSNFSFELLGTIRNTFGNVGMPITTRQRMGQALNLIVGAVIANAWSQKIRGKDVVTVGSGIPIAGGFVDEKIQQAQGEMVFGSRQVIGPFGDVDQWIRAVMNFSNHGDFSGLRKQLLVYLMGGFGIGGAVQVNRFIDGIQAAEKGHVTKPDGTPMFLLDDFSKVVAPFTGPFSTPSFKEHQEIQERKAEFQEGLPKNIKKELLKDILQPKRDVKKIIKLKKEKALFGD